MEFNKVYYEEYWDFVLYFLLKGFGFVILYGNYVVSECIFIFLGYYCVEMDIYIFEEYRGMGLVYCVVSEFIEYCLKNGIIFSWDCDVCNNLFIILVVKLGFKKIIEYFIFYFGKL